MQRALLALVALQLSSCTYDYGAVRFRTEPPNVTHAEDAGAGATRPAPDAGSARDGGPDAR